jgi:dTDP-4-dehydrorhamnose 3,5-epimerase
MSAGDSSCEGFTPGPFRGLAVYTPRIARDARGEFTKSFHQPTFASAGIDFVSREDFHSVSRRGVVRGMHFQAPPAGQAKLVSCLRGRILDVLLDLRRSEPTYGQFWSIELSPAEPRVLFLPVGLAHGFLALEDGAEVHYRCSAPYDPGRDQGIRWDSFGFNWPETAPLVSSRDAAFPPFRQFSSPF